VNHVALIGRLTNDPEIRATNGGSQVANFSIAVNRNFKNASGNYDADFINCIAFGKTAEFVEKYFFKGMKAAVQGRIQTGSYTNRDGNKVYTTDVIVSDIEFVEKRENNQQAQAQPQPQYQAQPNMVPNAQTATQNGFNGVPQGNYQPQYQNPPQGAYAPQNGGQPMTAQQAEQPMPGWMNVPDNTPELPFN